MVSEDTWNYSTRHLSFVLACLFSHLYSRPTAHGITNLQTTLYKKNNTLLDDPVLVYSRNICDSVLSFPLKNNISLAAACVSSFLHVTLQTSPSFLPLLSFFFSYSLPHVLYLIQDDQKVSLHSKSVKMEICIKPIRMVWCNSPLFSFLS